MRTLARTLTLAAATTARPPLRAQAEEWSIERFGKFNRM